LAAWRENCFVSAFHDRVFVPRFSTRTAPQWKPAPKAANTTGLAVIGWPSKYSAAAIGIDAEEVFPKRWMLQ
jgi:hypothetical protein